MQFSPLASLQKFRQGILSKLKTHLKRSVHPLGQKAYLSFLPWRKEGLVLMYFSYNLDIWADTELNIEQKFMKNSSIGILENRYERMKDLEDKF